LNRVGRGRVHLLREIEKYLRASGTPPTRFGRLAVRDPRLVHDLRRGREAGWHVTKRVMAYLEAVR
jgi:hypothetical protein